MILLIIPNREPGLISLQRKNLCTNKLLNHVTRALMARQIPKRIHSSSAGIRESPNSKLTAASNPELATSAPSTTFAVCFVRAIELQQHNIQKTSKQTQTLAQKGILLTYNNQCTLASTTSQKKPAEQRASQKEKTPHNKQASQELNPWPAISVAAE